MKPSPFDRMSREDVVVCLEEHLRLVRDDNLSSDGRLILSLSLVDRACAIMNCLAALGFVWGDDLQWLVARVAKTRAAKRGGVEL